MNIPSHEYTQSRSVFQHCDWVDQTLRNFEAAPEFYEAYYERKGLNVKRFIEEAVPVSYFALHFWRTWREIAVTCLASNEPYDAVIELQGTRGQVTIQVEVTSTETEETTMRRQALARDGIVSITGPVTHQGRTIHSYPLWMNTQAECEHILDIAFERFRAKAECEHDPQTAILVYVDMPWLIPVWQRHQLMERTR